MKHFRGGALWLCRPQQVTCRPNNKCPQAILETPKPTPKSRNTKKHSVYTNFFEKFARTVAFFPVTRVRNPTEIVQKNLFRWTFLFWVDFFRVDFPPDIPHRHMRHRPRHPGWLREFLSCPDFPEISGIRGNFGEFREIREISGKFRETQWNSMGLCMALNVNSVGIPRRRVFGKIWGLGWFRAIWCLKIWEN